LRQAGPRRVMEEAEYCDRLVIMDQGEILAEGTPA
jgi:ABC-type multidrug transport system ATPase subunit